MTPAASWLRDQLGPMEAALKALVDQNSFTQNRAGGQAVVDLLLTQFALPGAEVRRVASRQFADHVVIRTAGVGAPVALVGHLDTVFPPGRFEGYRVDGSLRRGPGVLDMKGGLVVMAWALQALSKTGVLATVPPLRVVIVSDEEVGSPEGAPILREEVNGCRAALVFESGRVNDAIVTQRKGTGSATAYATGKAAHAGNAYWDGANAIWALARYVDRVQHLSSKDTGVTVNVGVVAGGTTKNTVPADARAELDLRYPTAEQGKDLLRSLEAAGEGLGVPGAQVRFELGPGRPPMERQPGTDALLQHYGDCARHHGLGTSEAPRQGGGSDGNTTTALGVPTLDALGPRGRFFHTPEEYIEVDTLIPRAQALADFLAGCNRP